MKPKNPKVRWPRSRCYQHVPLSRENAPWMLAITGVPWPIYLSRKLTKVELETVRFDVFMGRRCRSGQPEHMAKFTHDEFKGGLRFGTIQQMSRNHWFNPKAPKATSC